MKIQDLIDKKDSLINDKTFNLNEKNLDAIFEIMKVGKIAKPDELFKKTINLPTIKKPTEFMFINVGEKGSYFLHNCSFPLGAQGKNALMKAKKELTKAKDKAKKNLELKIFFLESLAAKVETKIKGYAIGKMFFVETKGDDCIMEIKTNGLIASGKVKKMSLSASIIEHTKNLADKNGKKMKFAEIAIADDGKKSENGQNSDTAEDSPFANLTAAVDKKIKAFYDNPIKERFSELRNVFIKLHTLAKTLPKEDRITYSESAKKYKKAEVDFKNGIQPKGADNETETETETVTLSDTLAALEAKTKEKATTGSILKVLELMSSCQEIRVSPQHKNALKKDPALLDRFKKLRANLSAILKKDQAKFAEIEAMIEDPEKIKNKFQTSLDGLWENFSAISESSDSFEDILKSAETLEKNILVFQKGVEAQAKGILEASNMLKIGDKVEISKNMTAVRSGIVKLKMTMKDKVAETKQLAAQMAAIEAQFFSAGNSKIKAELFATIEKLAGNFVKNNEPVSVF